MGQGNEVPISTLTTFIDQALLKHSGSSLAQSDSLEPLVHEVVHYLKMACLDQDRSKTTSTTKQATLFDCETLITFRDAFEIVDSQYDRILGALLQECF